MQIHAFSYDLDTKAWSIPTLPAADSLRTLVLAFGAPETMTNSDALAQLSKTYPRSIVLGCSSAGEIHGTTVRDKSISVTVAKFDKTDLVMTSLDVAGPQDSFATGQSLAKKLASRPGLRGVLILSEGLNVNGSELVRGVNAVLDENIVVAGGLSGDGTRFKQTWVAVGAKIKSNVVAAVGFYGDYIQIGHGSKGGWDKFGPERVVTRSEGNILYELDGKPALQLYKEYLGDKAKELPASGLLFPLTLRSSTKDDKSLVRTILAVDHEKNSLTFAGDIPKGYLAQLMKADFDRLIGGASLATAMAKDNGAPIGKSSLVVAISCVGRRLVLGDRIEEEVEAVLDALPKTQQSHITGFYSYGEISPYASGHCDLHNQTMTLTVLSESDTPLPKRVVARQDQQAEDPTHKDLSARAKELIGAARVAPPPPAAAPAPARGMMVESFGYDLEKQAWSMTSFPDLDSARTLVLAFGAPEVMAGSDALAQLAKAYPKSILLGCSSAGEIHGTTVRDKSISVSVARFDKTDIALTSIDVSGPNDSFATGQSLAKKLGARPGLRGVLILSEGLNVNGSELVRGVNAVLDDSVVVAGGLSGDGTRFKQTWVAVGSKLKSNVVAAVGFYGDYVQIGHGSKGGWDKFGPERVVTKSEGNVLYELDGKPALQLYKEYLGDKAKDLPASGLLFPLSLRASSKDEKSLVRTLLAVDHEKNTLTFAGDLPKGYLAQLMKADFDRLIGGASLASSMAKANGTPLGKHSLVVAISCVGRRLVLGDRIEEEVEAVLDALPKNQQSHITGFYSYGEISPYATGHCDLHNQTMTLTVFSESDVPLPRRAAPAVAASSNNSPTVRPPPPAPPPMPARSAPPVPPTVNARRSPIEEIDLELEGSTRPLAAPPQAFSVASFFWDHDAKKWSVPRLPELDSPRTLVLGFGAPEILEDTSAFGDLVRAYPKSVVLGCSSAGEIHGTTVRDRSIAVTVTRFDKTDLVMTSLDVAGPNDSFATGQAIAKKLAARGGLRGILILSEGLNVNGSELVRGVNAVVDESVVVAGGLSGDGTRFKQTWVAVGSNVKSNVVAAIGFYGDHIQIGHGSKGGWDKFGPERVVTKSEGNVLYELDGKPALTLYKEYLGDKAKDLPASGLLFPLSLRASSKDDKALVRTLLAVDHEKNTLTFAGDVPKGYLAQLMKADFDRLIGGASLASAMAKENGAPIGKDSLVIAISCVGRRLVLGDRIEEEVEAVLDALPKNQQSHITGFYSYGEISPYATGHCDLHNQTMTLTVFSESATPLPRRPAKRAGEPAQAAPPPARVPAPAPLPAPAPAPAATRSPIVETNTTPSLLVGNPALSSPPVSSSPMSTGSFKKHGGPVSRIPLQPSGTGSVVSKQKKGDVTVVTITGRLTESFKGEALGRDLHGTVAFDLAGVDRITSFGVREWLSMLGAMQDVRRLFLLRASEAVVNQLSMIRKFSGNGQIVSFFAPYLCSGCGESFDRQFDCEHDGDAIRDGRADDAKCPRCEGIGHFDDDARSYFAFVTPHLSTPVPEEIRAIQDQLDTEPQAAPRDAVEKIVEGNLTRVRVQTKLGPSIRWKRVLDGIEGGLVLDLGGITGVEPAGIANLEQAIGTLGQEVSKIVLERIPSQLAERLAQTGSSPRVSVTSAMIDAQCGPCAVSRSALVSVQEHADALAHGQVPRVHCKRCNAELHLDPANRTLAFLRAQVISPANPREQTLKSPPAGAGMPAMHHGTYPTPGHAAPPSGGPTALSASPISVPMPLSLGGMAVNGRSLGDDAPPPSGANAPRPPERRGLTIAVAALGVAVLLLGAVQLTRSSAAPTAANGAPAAASASNAAPKEASPPPAGWMQSVELPPAWVERPFVMEGSDVLIVGKGDLSATPEQAMSQARNDAIVRLVKQVQTELAGSPISEFLQTRTHEERGASANEAIANRYLKQFATTASPERVDAALRKREAGVEGFARYKLSKATYQSVVASYRETAQLQGMVVGRFFPLLETTMHTDGDLIVLSVIRGRNAAEQGVRPGDIVLSVGGRPVTAPDTFNKASNEEWASTPVRGSLPLEIESAGAKRTIRFFKPAPPNP